MLLAGNEGVLLDCVADLGVNDHCVVVAGIVQLVEQRIQLGWVGIVVGEQEFSAQRLKGIGVHS